MFFLNRKPSEFGLQTNCCGTPVDIPRIACFEIGDDRVEATRFLLQNTSDKERIFVGIGRHDKIVLNDNVTYFAAGRLPAELTGTISILVFRLKLKFRRR